ncbi:MATE family efflux transporter [Okeania sp. SIO1I7]|uniref:MATE family efflux transporter n=1 Tax=Okeania sp. SIO1I7 TaxID=2607772 RepID=UPI0013FA6671|nr:MATE family efflux transporter [Okeania sp. SIO1I7]NET27488.1 MATE family efflux transporter [Okeania sp. SIO1I7]
MKLQLTEGRVGPLLLKLTLPMVWGVFAVIGFNIVDTYFVGQLGTNELAAMSFTFPVVMVLGSVSMGLGTGASSIIARAIGEGDRHKVKRLTTDSLTLSLLIVGIFVILGLTTIDPIFTALGAKAEIIPLIREYMQTWYLGVIFLVVPMVGNNAIRAAGNTLIPSVIMIIAGVVNAVLDPILIFGVGKIPAMGLQGAALATVIGRATTLIASLLFLHYRERMISWSLPSFNLLLRNWQSILYIGIPAAATNMITPISITFITSLVANYGIATVAGFGIASKVESFSIIVPIALSASFSPFVGQNWGAKKYNRVYLGLRLGFQFCLLWGVLLAIALGVGGSLIASIFDPNPEVIEIAAKYLLIVPISYGTSGIILISSATFNALGKPLPSVVMTMTRMLFLYVPLAYLGSWLFGVNGIFVAACFANLAVGIGAYIWNQKTCSLKMTAQQQRVENIPEVVTPFHGSQK